MLSVTEKKFWIFGTRDYPTKCATQYRPDIDPASHNFIRDVPLSAEETEAAAAAQLKRKRTRKGLKEEDEEADKKQKLKKNKNDEYDDDDDDDIATDFVASTSNRTTGFNVEDNLKSTFDNHEVGLMSNSKTLSAWLPICILINGTISFITGLYF